MSKEILSVKHCIQKIEEKLNWGKIEEWNEVRYEELAKLISDKTGISISPFILYDSFVVRRRHTENSLPNMEVKNALAQFLNYSNWEHFEYVLTNEKNNRSLRSMIVGFVLLTFCFVFLIAYERKTNLEISEFQFELKEATSSTIPYTATFLYDISKLEKEVFIDFGLINFDSREEQVMTKLNPKDSIIRFVYTRNGVYHPRLFIRNSDQTLKQLDINIKSEYWNVFAYQDGKCKELEYLDSREEEYLSIDDSAIRAKGFDTAKEYKTLYTLCKNYGVDLDNNFDLEFQFRSTPSSNSSNSKEFQVELECNQLVQLSFSNSQNVETSKIRMSDFYAKNTPTEMKDVKVDLNLWHAMRIHLNKGELEIFIDNQQVFNHHYTQSLGKLKEIRFEFSGNGSIKNVVY